MYVTKGICGIEKQPLYKTVEKFTVDPADASTLDLTASQVVIVRGLEVFDGLDSLTVSADTANTAMTFKLGIYDQFTQLPLIPAAADLNLGALAVPATKDTTGVIDLKHIKNVSMRQLFGATFSKPVDLVVHTFSAQPAAKTTFTFTVLFSEVEDGSCCSETITPISGTP